jgi:hypothetical protein
MNGSRYAYCLLMLIESWGHGKLQKRENWEQKKDPLKKVKVKRMLLYASLYAVPCNRRLRRQSNPGQHHDIRKISGDFLRFSVNYVGSLSMI